MVAFSFNTAGFTPTFAAPSGLSAGKHPVVISKSDWQPTKDTKGTMLVLTLEAFDGPDKGNSQILRLNLNNESAKAMKIANDQLTAICHVVGMPGGFQQATDELHNKPFVVEIGAQASNDKFTEVKAVYDMNGNLPGHGAPVAAQPQTFAAPTTQAAPQPMQQAPVPQNQPWAGQVQPATNGTGNQTQAPPPPWKR